MSSTNFRKLDLDLPRQPSVDERPWLAAGLLLAFIILLMSAYAYFDNAKEGAFPGQKKKIALEVGIEENVVR